MKEKKEAETEFKKNQNWGRHSKGKLDNKENGHYQKWKKELKQIASSNSKLISSLYDTLNEITYKCNETTENSSIRIGTIEEPVNCQSKDDVTDKCENVTKKLTAVWITSFTRHGPMRKSSYTLNVNTAIFMQH